MRKKVIGFILGVAMVFTACQGGMKPQDYVSKDGSFTVTFPEGMEKSEFTVTTGSVMMGLDSGDSGLNGSVLIQESDKSFLSKGQEVESLEDYRDYINNMYLKGQGMSVDWEEESAVEMEGFNKCLDSSGSVNVSGAKWDAYANYMETDGRYYMVLMVGDKKDVKSMQSVFALKENEDLAVGESQSATAEDFIYAMTAALDSINGVNMFMTMKMLEEQGQDVSAMESSARQMIEQSWNITSRESLMDTANELIEGMHNPVALELLEQYHVTPEMSREELIRMIEERDWMIVLRRVYWRLMMLGHHLGIMPFWHGI